MSTARVEYLGELRTKCTHLYSGSQIITDAPLDNKGKAENFSPTDLVATAYASCMITIMGIFCNEHGINFQHATADVTKVMASGPRRISEVIIKLDLSGNGWSEDEKERVLRAGNACPVAKSVHEDMKIEFEFIF
jgi:putative redox protein